MHTPRNIRKRGNLPREATAHLKEWLRENRYKPYPTDQEKNKLCSETNLTNIQVANWFINARRRILPGMLLQDGHDPKEFLIKKNVGHSLKDLPSNCEAVSSRHSTKSESSRELATSMEYDNHSDSDMSTLSASSLDDSPQARPLEEGRWRKVKSEPREEGQDRPYFAVSPVEDWSINKCISKWSGDDDSCSLPIKKDTEDFPSEQNGLVLLAISCELHISQLKAAGLWDR